MGKYGILVISHGSKSGEWVRLVDEAVAQVQLPPDVPVESSFLEIVEGRLIQDGINRLEAAGVTQIMVIPLFISSGSTHMDEIRYALGIQPQPVLPTEMTPFKIRAGIHCADPIDDDPEIAGIVLEKLAGISRRPGRELLLLIGHGSAEHGFHERWRDGLGKLASRVKELGGYAEADTAMLLPDQAGEKLKYWSEHRPELDVIVAPLFLSEGYFTNHVIPERLRGYTYRYSGLALLPHPGISRWMERQAGQLLSMNSNG